MGRNHHPPPPTKFGPATAQAKPAQTHGHHAPPATKFGAPPIQRAPAPGRLPGHAPPPPGTVIQRMQEEEKEEKTEFRRSKRERHPPGTKDRLMDEETQKMREFEVDRIQKKRIEKAAIKKRVADLTEKSKKKKKTKIASNLDTLKDLSIEIGNGTGQDVTAVGSMAGGQLHAAAQRPQLAQSLRAALNDVTWHQDNPGDNVHAEMWLLYLCPDITSISADRPICARCAAVLDTANVNYDKAYIQASTPNWTNPWQRANIQNAFTKYQSYAKDKAYTFTF